MDENNPKFLDYSEDEALLGAGLVAFLHMGGDTGLEPHPDGSPQKVHGGNEGSSDYNSLSSLSKTIDVSDSPKPIGAIKDLIVYRVGSTSEKEVYFGDNIEQVAPYASFHEGHEIKRYKVSADNVLAAKNHGQLFRKLFNKSWGEEIANLDVRLKLNDSKEAWRRLQSRMMNKVRSMGYDAVIFTFPDSKGMQEFVYLGKNKGRHITSELHMQGQHDQQSHGNDVASSSYDVKPKQMKQKKVEIKTEKKNASTELIEVGKDKYNHEQPVYKVVSSGEKMFKDNVFSEDGLVLVGLRGEHKGVVLYTRPKTSHNEMLEVFDENSTDIDWAHFYIEFDQQTGKENLFIDAYYAGYDVFGEAPDQPDYMEKVYDNLHIAQKALVKAGVNPKRTVTILEPVNEFKNRTPWEVKLEELSMSNELLAELGGKGSGFYGHKGRDAEDKQGGSLARGGFFILGKGQTVEKIKEEAKRLPEEYYVEFNYVSVGKITTPNGMGGTFIGTYTPQEQIIKIDPKNPHPERTFYHEMGHQVHWLLKRNADGSKLNKDWSKLCRSEYKKFSFISPYDSLCEEPNETFAEMFRIFYFDKKGDRKAFRKFLKEKNQYGLDNAVYEKPFFEMLDNVIEVNKVSKVNNEN